jgi:hypothetical protein
MSSQSSTLQLRLPYGMAHEEAIELLGAADCTETLVGVGERGILTLLFDGPVALSEIAEVARAIPDALVLRFTSDTEDEI